MSGYSTIVHPDGTAQITTPTGVHDLAGYDVPDVRRLVVEQLVSTARQHDRVLRVLATDDEGTLELHVHPGGDVEVHDPVDVTTGLGALEDTRPHPLTATPTPVRLTFSTQPEVVVTARAAIGRNPDVAATTTAVRVVSPGRMLSRTHAFIEVDEAGRILLTDNHSGNGIALIGDTPSLLAPGKPYVISPGTSVLMGDVTCTIDYT